MLRTGLVVVRRTTRVSASSSSIARVVSETAIATVCPAWIRPRAIFWPQTTITPVALARRAGPAANGNCTKLHTSPHGDEKWPPGEYTFRLPLTGLPVYVDHQEEQAAASGFVPGDIGAARRFAEVDGIGLVTLIEIHAPAVLWDLAAGRRTGLSIGYCLDPPPDGGPEWVYLREVSLTSQPGDPRARVVSSGRLALHNWEVLTGEFVPAC
jgi:hypothetical protein